MRPVEAFGPVDRPGVMPSGASSPAVADPLQASGQHVFEEAVEEVFGREAHGAGAALVIAIGKGDRRDGSRPMTTLAWHFS